MMLLVKSSNTILNLQQATKIHINRTMTGQPIIVHNIGNHHSDSSLEADVVYRTKPNDTSCETSQVVFDKLMSFIVKYGFDSRAALVIHENGMIEDLTS